jgi:hypothetical protein
MALVTNNYQDGVTYTGATSSTVGPFTILGGKYLLYGTAAGTSYSFNLLMPDGSTYQAVYSGTTSAYTQVADLPPGTYEIVIVSASAQQGGLVKIPYRPTA